MIAYGMQRRQPESADKFFSQIQSITQATVIEHVT